jgi:hypothetical protein
MATQVIPDELQKLVEDIKEYFLNNTDVTDYVNAGLVVYCEQLGFDGSLSSQMTETQEELVCQFQRSMYHHIFAEVIKQL